MNKYFEISTNNYCIQKLKCRCNKCKYEFSDIISLNYEMVCFEDNVGDKYFLPTYGENGYLDLLDILVEEWNPNREITKTVTDKFEKRLKEITPFDISLSNKVRCPNCKADDIFICDRNTHLNYPINWLKIDKKKLKES